MLLSRSSRRAARGCWAPPGGAGAPFGGASLAPWVPDGLGPRDPGDRDALRRATERAVRYSVADLGEAVCGGFAVREPAEGIRLQQSVSGVDWLDDFLRWVQELVGYGQETRELFVKELLAGHEIAALAMRDELKPLATAIFESRAGLG